MDYSPLFISLKVGVFATIINLFIGTYIAYIVSKINKGKGIIDGFLTLPLILPPTVIGFFLLILLGQNGFLGKLFLKFNRSLIFTETATIIAGTIVSFPLMYRSIRGAFEDLDNDLINAARTLGLKEYEILLKIIIPNTYSSILAGIVLTFARSLGEFGATIMIAGNIPKKTQTMSLAIYSAVQSGNRILAYKWVALMSIISFISIILINKLNGRRFRS